MSEDTTGYSREEQRHVETLALLERIAKGVERCAELLHRGLPV